MAFGGADQTVHLPGDLRLVLEIDGDPRPCPRPEARVDDGFPDEDGTASADAATAGAAGGSAAKKKSSSTLVQLGIIGFCVLGMAAFLTMGGGEETNAAKRPTFEGIVETTLAKDTNVAARALLPRLQYAQAAFVRGHDQLAKQRFLKLRDQLVRQSETLTEKDLEDAKQMLDYVEFRLSQLQ